MATSIFQAVVTQTISGLACGRPIRGHVAFLGGPLQYLSELRHRFCLTLDLDDERIIVPGTRICSWPPALPWRMSRAG